MNNRTITCAWAGLVPLGVIRVGGRVGLLLLVVAAGGEAGGRGGLREADGRAGPGEVDGRVGADVGVGGRGVEGAVLVLGGVLAPQVRRLRRRERARGGVGQLLLAAVAGAGLRVLAGSHGGRTEIGGWVG